MILPLLLLAPLNADRLAPGSPEGARRIGRGQLLSAAVCPKNLDNPANERPPVWSCTVPEITVLVEELCASARWISTSLTATLPTSETGFSASEGEPRL